ncbi:Clp protease N-terminal domain-containing protein [Rugosimonospora africana]|nr:Clp protease N-terminal domain-containing protein [Rugosimonospora africana]
MALLLGLLRDEDCLAARILTGIGATAADLRERVHAAMSEAA